MSLAQLLEKAPTDPRRKCGVGTWLRGLDPHDQAAFDTVVDEIRNRTGGWRVSSLHRVMKDAGFTLGRTVVEKHVNKECACVAG